MQTVRKKPKSADLQKQVITSSKQTEERAWLSEVSNIPLQQSVADLETAFKNFFESCKGKRKGHKVGYPKFKKRTNSQSARLTRGGFSIKKDGVYLAKIGIVKPIWSRQLPSEPSSVTVIKDCANRYFLSFVVEINPEIVDAKNHNSNSSIALKHRAIARRSDAIRESTAPLSMSVKLLNLLSSESAEDKLVRADLVRNVDRKLPILPLYCRSRKWLK